MSAPVVIAGFTLGPVVHRGGMAVLREVTHPDHPGPLLMKMPKLAEGEDPAAIVSFEMEQMILPRLTGPHVPKCYGTGHEPTPWIVMERIGGGSLLPMLKRLPRAPGEVAVLAASVADALDGLHRQGVVHLDVKPSNILRRAGEDGPMVLVDFGLSRAAMLPDLMEEEFRLPYGTAPYMAPEQIMGIRGDPASDLFALGVLMYFFVTGRRPFGDPQRMAELKERIWSDPTPPRALVPECPPWLQEVILRCLEPDPSRRPASAAQLAFDLRNPEAIALGPRAAKLKRDAWSKRVQRRFHPDFQPRLHRKAAALPQRDAPIVAVALDLDDMSKEMSAALLDMVGRLLAIRPNARIACLNVLRSSLLRQDNTLDREGRNKHVQRLLELRHWSAPLALPEYRLTHHVLEAVSAGGAILEYASQNRVDHLILGAKAGGITQRVMGSIPTEVARDAPCSVTMVRVREF
jgi:serine/threonine protein kinase